jgi:hypothetical protein
MAERTALTSDDIGDGMAAWLLGTAKLQMPTEIIAAVIASLDIG